MPTLTVREVECLIRSAEVGRAQAGRDLGISPLTVKRHLQDLYGKIGAGSMAHAVLLLFAVEDPPRSEEHASGLQPREAPRNEGRVGDRGHAGRIEGGPSWS